MLIEESQRNSLMKMLQESLKEGQIDNQGELSDYWDFWKKREEGIASYKPLIESFLQSQVDLRTFKESSEKLCRKYPYWGFKGMSGQMQLNQYVNNIPDPGKEDVLRKVLQVPGSAGDAAQAINYLAHYLQELKETAANRKSIPRVNQSYMLSYFWEMLAPKKFPVYYGSSKKSLQEVGIGLDQFNTPGEEYLFYVSVMGELVQLFSRQTEMGDYPYWLAEHALWFHFSTNKPDAPPETKTTKKDILSPTETAREQLWTPPIVADLAQLASNQETEWSKSRNLRPEKALETKLRYAFTLLGFQTEELGQGTGREPDGVAVSVKVHDGDYALIYDAKARSDGFYVGTSDRTIKEYLLQKVTRLQRQRIQRFYFLVISSNFDPSPAHIAVLKDVDRQTRVPVVLVRAADLLLLIEEKLKNTEIDHMLIEQLFLDTGILTREKIVETLGVK